MTLIKKEPYSRKVLLCHEVGSGRLCRISCPAVLSAHTCIAHFCRKKDPAQLRRTPGVAIRALWADRQIGGGPQASRCGALAGALVPAVTGQGRMKGSSPFWRREVPFMGMALTSLNGPQ